MTRADPIRTALERLLSDIQDLSDSSQGIVGLHRNGDPAPWNELLEGGRYSSWLGDAIAAARAALDEPEPEVGEPVKQIAQIVYERAMMAAADAASRPHWPSWAELPESDAYTHAMATAQAILTSCGYYTESETETAERPAVTLRTLLHPGFEPGDGNADGAQLVDGQWHVPVMGCDSLQIAVDNARAALDRPKPNRLADALALTCSAPTESLPPRASTP